MLDKQEWQKMQDEYYQRHNDKNGVPTTLTIERLQIEPVSLKIGD